MTMNCPHCGNVIECDIDLVCGQRVLCPYCETKFVYDGGSGAHKVVSVRKPTMIRQSAGGKTAIALIAAVIVAFAVALCVVMRIRRPGCSGDIGMIINVNQPDEVLAAKAYEAFMDGDLEKASRYAEAMRDEASRIMLVSTFKDIERAKEEARKAAKIEVDVARASEEEEALTAEDALTDEEGARARAAADSIHEDAIMSIGN